MLGIQRAAANLSTKSVATIPTDMTPTEKSKSLFAFEADLQATEVVI